MVDAELRERGLRERSADHEVRGLKAALDVGAVHEVADAAKKSVGDARRAARRAGDRGGTLSSTATPSLLAERATIVVISASVYGRSCQTKPKRSSSGLGSCPRGSSRRAA